MDGRDGSGVFETMNAGVPESSRKVVQILKEIVNCSDLEIYIMLLECDMDPHEATIRLLSQDTFHEVKSKRNKKKESKNHTDSWMRSTPNHGARSFNDSYNTPRGGGKEYNSNEMGSGQGSPISLSPPLPIGYPSDVEQISPTLVSSKHLHDHDSRDSSVCDDESHKAERHSYEENGAKDIFASVATSFQQLKIKNEEEHETLPKEGKLAVIIPNHLQAHTVQCSHLMFGSYGSGIGYGQASGLNDKLDEPLKTEDDSSFRHFDTNFFGEEEEQLTNAITNEQVSYQIDSSAQNYQSAMDSETEAVQHEPSQEKSHQYKFLSSADGQFGNNQRLNPLLETNLQMQNLDTFSNVMQQGYTSSLPNTFFPSCIQDEREFDILYSPLLTIYNNATPCSLSSSSISKVEPLRVASISPQSAMPSAVSQASTLLQHLTSNHYSHQHGMPLGLYGNWISYPLMPQSYNPYLNLGFQQFSAGNHQFLHGVLPQYKAQATVLSAVTPSDYGFGGGASSSNNLHLNSTSVANSCEDVLSSHFKDSNHLASSLQQQNEYSETWHQTQQSDPRMIPGSRYYSFPSLQPPSFHQAQQLMQQQQQQQQQLPSQQQHFGGYGYVSPHHSQAGTSSDQLHHQHKQQQNDRDASKQKQKQLWSNDY